MIITLVLRDYIHGRRALSLEFPKFSDDTLELLYNAAVASVGLKDSNAKELLDFLREAQRGNAQHGGNCYMQFCAPYIPGIVGEE